jgi:hypothetical protein
VTVAVFAPGKRGANDRARLRNYLISKGFDFDGVKVGFGVIRSRVVNRGCENSVKLDAKTRLVLQKILIDHGSFMVSYD